MTDIRRTLLWVVFTMSLVLLWDAWNRNAGHPSMFGVPTPTTVPAAAAGSTPLPTPASTVAPSAAQAIAAAPGAANTTGASELIEVKTDLATVKFDTIGASVIGLELLHYRDQDDQQRNVHLFDRSAQRVYQAQSGLVGAAGAPNHLSAYKLVSADRELKEGENTLSLRFESTTAGAVKVAKTYTFTRGSYAVAVKHEVINGGTEPVSPQLYVQLVRDGNPASGGSVFYSTYTGPAIYTEAAKFQKVDFTDIEKGKGSHEKAGNNGWVAMVQHYFASAWLNNSTEPREFYTRKVDTNLYAVGMLFALPPVAPGATQTNEDTLFAGPQEEKVLSALAPGLDLVRDYGWFTILAKPLYWLLDKLHSMIGNWGFAIVLLVVLLRIAFYGLNVSAYRSMAKMKAINPRITELRERMKDKPQQMQQEMMRIYKEEKVNPLGGCLPIMVQIPFFIALYSVLLSSVEMRGAPWIGWIHDLSIKDPYYVLPLLMTASTMLQTWLNPTPPDPVQAKMMWIMPLVFSVMFFSFPAGLVLYWVTNNILAIAQQWIINKRLGVLGK